MSEPGTQRRPWWKLHFSTKVVIAIVVVGLVFANVPGQQVMHVEVPDEGKYGPHYGPYPRYEHGWPSSYMVRQYPARWGNPRSVFADSCWALTHQVESFTAGWLALDFFMALLTVAVIAVGFEIWRRKRQSLWRFRLIELFGLLTLVACAGGWYQWQCRIAEGESVALKEARRDLQRVSPGNFASDDVEYERGGPTFLRQLVGDKPFAFQDRVVSAVIIDAHPRFANRFLHLKCIAPGSNGLDPEAAFPISQLPKLETIDLFMSSMGRLSEFPPMNTLRGINLYDSEVTERDLEWLGKCTNLEQIEMSNVNIGDKGLRHLLGLKKLQSYSAGGGYDAPYFTDECFELLARLDSLEELWLSGEFRGDKVELLLQLKRLRSLDLSSARFSPANMKRLEKFGHLKWLAVHGSAISEADIARLHEAIPNCKVYP